MLAAANPIYGDYDRSVPAAKNIGLPDSLLSRFDLLFVVLDEKNPIFDAKIAQRVIMNHQFRTEEQMKGNDTSNVHKMQHDDTIIEEELKDENQKTTPFSTIKSVTGEE